MPFPSRPGTYACVWASALLEVQVGVVLPDRTPHRSTEHLGIEPESDGTVLITHAEEVTGPLFQLTRAVEHPVASDVAVPAETTTGIDLPECAWTFANGRPGIARVIDKVLPSWLPGAGRRDPG